jgi:ribonucleotide reductase alpha subunit
MMAVKMTNTYSYSQVYEASIEYFGGDEFAAKVFVDKYALQTSQGEYLELTPSDMHRRLAKEFARIEAKYPNPVSEDAIFSLLDHFRFVVPQGSPMSAIGNPYQLQSLSNCFVVQGVHSHQLDSYGGIMMADQEIAQIMKRRGGVGLDISGIRPKDVITNNAAKTTDGIGVFMERYSNTCREVAQNGRRGALMITISINHPEIETFIKIKRDTRKVTGANISIRFNDEFMHAVKDDEEYTLRWPVEATPDTAKVTKKVRAREIWNQVIDSAWASAEPGLLFWDTVKRNTPSDLYAEFGHNSICTNPCFSGDTLIAVADGRNAVSIKQLAEEGKDVPVYSVDKNTGKVSIKIGRHPRITGYNKKLVRIILDDGSHFDITPDHKCLLRDGTEVLAKDLQSGDSLPRFTKALEPVKINSKDYYRIYTDINDSDKKIFEHRLIAQFYFPEEWKKIYNSAQEGGFTKTGGLVVHHKDYNQLNNSPDNLQIMTFREHQQFHAERDCAGEKNGHYSGFTAEEIRHHALELTKQLSRRFTHEDWVEYAGEHGLPQAFSSFRKDQFGSIIQLAKQCAAQLGIEYGDYDPRLVATYQDMLAQNYDAEIVGNQVSVQKTCEVCHSQFQIDHLHRESSICSVECKNLYLNSNQEVKARRDTSRDIFNENKMQVVKTGQARVYSQLKFDLGRDPMMKEWETVCKLQGIPSRIGKTLKFGYKNFKEVAEAGDNYNHKVVRIEELPGEHIVYNITVDDNHTLAVITGNKEKLGNLSYIGVYIPQCGEIVLPAYDACRLLVLNLSSYVKSPFTKDASFDFKKFNKHTQVAQRLMDDIIDLELECVDRILAKVQADPEPMYAKRVELDLWTKIRDMNKSGRRTGLGITALGDTLAMLGIKYGSKESIEMTRKIYRALAVGAHTSSCIMAEERGAFPIFNYELEKDHEYLNTIFADCPASVRKMWKTTGRRNIALTTTAPTGSVSSQTQTTSGIEPVYLLSYVRRKKHNPSDKNARVDFVDAMGDQWQEFTVYHHGVAKWMEVTGETDVTKSPYFGATSNDIDWVASVDLQAAAQKSIDHSISKTCNLPENVSRDVVSQVYMRAWEKGCKGFTVYRDKCRDGVLIQKETPKPKIGDRPDGIEVSMAPKRPVELPCDVRKAKIQGEQWTIFVGLLEGKPYEIFGGLSKYVDIPNKYKMGKIAKNGKVDDITTYNLVLGEGDDQMLVKDIANVFENANFGAFTRTISLALRHGTPVQYVVEQLQKDKHSDITSFSKVIARVLKNYIVDGTVSTAERKCPSCQKENSFAYQEKCLTCTNCGWSKC